MGKKGKGKGKEVPASSQSASAPSTSTAEETATKLTKDDTNVEEKGLTGPKKNRNRKKKPSSKESSQLDVQHQSQEVPNKEQEYLGKLPIIQPSSQSQTGSIQYPILPEQFPVVQQQSGHGVSAGRGQPPPGRGQSAFGRDQLPPFQENVPPTGWGIRLIGRGQTSIPSQAPQHIMGNPPTSWGPPPPQGRGFPQAQIRQPPPQVWGQSQAQMPQGSSQLQAQFDVQHQSQEVPNKEQEYLGKLPIIQPSSQSQTGSIQYPILPEQFPVDQQQSGHGVSAGRGQPPPGRGQSAFGRDQLPPFQENVPPTGWGIRLIGRGQTSIPSQAPQHIMVNPPTSWGPPPPQGRGSPQAQIRQPPPQVWGQSQAQMPQGSSQLQAQSTQAWGKSQAKTPQGSAQPKSQPPQAWGQAPAPKGPAQPQALPQQAQGQSQPAQGRSTAAVPPRSSDVGKGDSRSMSCRYQIPPKYPSGMVQSRSINVLANYLPLHISDITAYRYDTLFSPENPKKLYPQAMDMFLKKHFPGVLVAYDKMKNAFTSKPLKGVGDGRFTDTIVFPDPNGREIKFEISLKFTGSVKLGDVLQYMRNGTSVSAPMEAIQCIDVILRQGRISNNFVKAGRSFFQRPNNPLDLGDGLEMWTGLFQSAIFGSKSYINVDVAHKGFPKHQPVTQLIQEFRLRLDQPLDRQNRFAYTALESYLKGVKVSVYIGGDKSVKRDFMVNGISKLPHEISFEKTTNGKAVVTNVAEYFLKDKNYRLKYPNLNCLSVGPRDKNIHYPIELCEITYGQARNKQLNDQQLSKMVREAATKPNERFRKIQEIIGKVDYGGNAYYKEFGIRVDDKFIQIPAKILNAPILQYQDKTTMPRDGVWYSSRMLQSHILDKWGIIGLERDIRQCYGEDLVKLIQSEGRKMGINVSQPSMSEYNVDIRGLQQKLQIAAKNNAQLVIVIVPDNRRNDTYAQVKKIAECHVGILTQCIKERTLQRINPNIVSNIMLKVNSKLSGTNQALARQSVPKCLQGNIMVVGADVTHPSPDQRNIPSIAAVTASIDDKYYVYNVCLSIQSPKKEIIVEFEEMMIEHLQLYKKRMNVYPDKIYVYRDGVSEGQFAQVLDAELTAIYKACERLFKKQPQVLFLLVQKRHHTRLFLDAKNPKNVSPGTVVDKEIVHARELDFYLVSHAAIKGTARPTRYHCIRNDDKLPEDEVEQMTYYLCHLYSRCSRAVSYPVPTYYAHLACFRARALTMGQNFINADLEKKPQRLNIMKNMLDKNPMFFV